jgi:hypothetical protein
MRPPKWEPDALSQLASANIVTAVAAGGAEASEELRIGDGLEEVTDGGQGRAIVQTGPSEQGLCGMDAQGSPPGKSQL